MPLCSDRVPTCSGIPLPAVSIIKMELASGAHKKLRAETLGRGLSVHSCGHRQGDVIELLLIVEYQYFPGAEKQLTTTIYGLVQASWCWNKKLTTSSKTLSFEQSCAPNLAWLGRPRKKKQWRSSCYIWTTWGIRKRDGRNGTFREKSKQTVRIQGSRRGQLLHAMPILARQRST